MRFKLFLLSFLFVSCQSQKELIPDYYAVNHKNIRIINIDKKKRYYTIKGIDLLGDTLVFISKSKIVYSRTDINERVLTKLNVETRYVLDAVQLYPRAIACGSLGLFNIKVGNDILWNRFYSDIEKSSNKYFRILDDYYVINANAE